MYEGKQIEFANALAKFADRVEEITGKPLDIMCLPGQILHAIGVSEQSKCCDVHVIPIDTSNPALPLVGPKDENPYGVQYTWLKKLIQVSLGREYTESGLAGLKEDCEEAEKEIEDLRRRVASAEEHVEQLDADLQTAVSERDDYLGTLRNLLARIHRDGGQYTVQRGLGKSVEEAGSIVCELHGLVDEVHRDGDHAIRDVRPEIAAAIDAVDRMRESVAGAKEALKRAQDDRRQAIAERDEYRAELEKLTVKCQYEHTKQIGTHKLLSDLIDAVLLGTGKSYPTFAQSAKDAVRVVKELRESASAAGASNHGSLAGPPRFNLSPCQGWEIWNSMIGNGDVNYRSLRKFIMGQECSPTLKDEADLLRETADALHAYGEGDR